MPTQLLIGDGTLVAQTAAFAVTVWPAALLAITSSPPVTSVMRVPQRNRTPMPASFLASADRYFTGWNRAWLRNRRHGPLSKPVVGASLIHSTPVTPARRAAASSS